MKKLICSACVIALMSSTPFEVSASACPQKVAYPGASPTAQGRASTRNLNAADTAAHKASREKQKRQQKEKDAELKRLQEENERRQKEIERLKKAPKSNPAVVKELEERLAVQKKQNDVVQKQNDVVQKQLDICQGQLKKAGVDAVALENDKVRLQKALDEARQEFGAAIGAAEKHDDLRQKQLAVLEHTLDDHKQGLEKARADYNFMLDRAVALENDKERLHKALDEAQQKFDAAIGNEKEQAKKALNEAQQGFYAAIDAAEKHDDLRQKQLAVLENRVDDYKQELEKVRADYNFMLDRAVALENDKVRLQKALDEAQQEFCAAIGAAEKHDDLRQRQLAVLENRVDDYKQGLEKVRADYNFMLDRAVALENDKVRLQKALDEARQEFGAAIGAAEKHDDLRQRQLAVLEHTLDDYKQGLEKVRADYNFMLDRAVALENDKVRLQKALDEAQQKFDAAIGNEKEQTKKALNEAQQGFYAAIDAAEKHDDLRQKQLAVLEHTLDDYKQGLEKVRADYNSMLDRAVALGNDKTKIEKLRKNVASVQTDMSVTGVGSSPLSPVLNINDLIGRIDGWQPSNASSIGGGEVDHVRELSSLVDYAKNIRSSSLRMSPQESSDLDRLINYVDVENTDWKQRGQSSAGMNQVQRLLKPLKSLFEGASLHGQSGRTWGD
ncbi:hypothetical protein FACS1894122_00310 [Alphaproteobacteria bacterium]|nr:hypothetical protein FACS1894122_00070 [Alphaproteobacteria bacterium]GHT90340.1 hypothetical protein FACS1894122_00310 [Alphaproteobacteria bacterium]